MTNPVIVIPKSSLLVNILTCLFVVSSVVSSVAAPQSGAKGAISIEIIEGQNAINNVTRNTAYEPIVEVRDASGKAIARANVTFTLPAVGPSGVFTDGSKTLMIQTDASGRAAARGLRPNNQVGQFEIRITAFASGQTARAIVTQTNAAPAVTASRSGKKLAIVLAIVGGGAIAVAAAAAGGGGGTSPQQPGPRVDPVAGSITPGTPGFGPPR